jgi:site-specific DNA recombinase
MRIAFYVRVSTQRQAQAQTVEQQLERLKRYAEEQSWAVPVEHIFRDDGYSGGARQEVGGRPKNYLWMNRSSGSQNRCGR